MKVYAVRHQVSYSGTETISTHRTVQGAAIAAYRHAIRTFRLTNGAFDPDPPTQWDENDDLPRWKWSDHEVDVVIQEMET